MKIDKYGCIVMEQNPEGDPGNLGDSCAETGRYQHLCRQLGETDFTIYLGRFITDAGILRHPDSPWREDDTSSDQVLPLYLGGTDLTKARVKIILQRAGYRTGNGDFINPKLFALIKDNTFLLNISLAAQAAIFKLPYRWNDEKKWFESTEGSSADYLNFIHAALYASSWVRRLVSKEKLIERVQHYYRVEPNSAWVVDLYKRVIQEKW